MASPRMMVKRASLNLSQVTQNHRLGLWILLLLLTALIMLFPVHLHYEYHAIESLYIFGNNLALFAILFYIWVAILLLLLFSRGRNSEWQRLALVCIFALVFFGFWAINTPTGGHWDELWNMAHIKYLQETGNIPSLHPNVGYFQFPALHLTAFSISEICGLGIFATRTLFILFSSVLFAALSYLLFMKLLKNSSLSSLAVLLIATSLVMTRSFWPGNLGILFLILILALLAGREDRALRTSVALIILLAFTISYLPASASFIFILVGIYLLQKVAKRSLVVWSTIALFLTMFLAWGFYRATAFSGGLVEFIPSFVAGFINPIERLFSGASLAVPSFGGDVPLWAKAARFLLLALTMGLGAILGTWNLARARKLSPIEVLQTGGLLGVSVFFIVCFLATPGTDQGFRAMMYLPFFTVPIMLASLSRFSRHNRLSRQNTVVEDPEESFNSHGFHRSLASFWGWLRRHVFTLLIILFFVLSLPAFLLDQPAVCSTAIYPYEHSAGEFVESAYWGEELSLFSEVYTRWAYTYYALEAHFHNVLPARSEEGLLLDINNLMDAFKNSEEGNAIFVLTERFRQPYHQPAIVESTDPRWVEIVNRLEENSKIYDNGHIKIYKQ